MSITSIRINEWTLQHDGKVIPRLHFDPVTVKGNLIGQVPAYSFWYVMEHGLGVGAIIFIDVRAPGRTGYISHVNFPMIPNVPLHCQCGKLLSNSGRHLQCLEPKKKCTQRGIYAWLNDKPIHWVDATLTHERITFIRDNPNYFHPRPT